MSKIKYPYWLNLERIKSDIDSDSIRERLLGINISSVTVWEGTVEARLLIFAGDDLYATTLRRPLS